MTSGMVTSPDAAYARGITPTTTTMALIPAGGEIAQGLRRKPRLGGVDRLPSHPGPAQQVAARLAAQPLAPFQPLGHPVRGAGGQHSDPVPHLARAGLAADHLPYLLLQ